MKDKLSQIQKQIRSQQKQKYFQQKRNELYRHYQITAPHINTPSTYHPKLPIYLIPNNPYSHNPLSSSQQMEEQRHTLSRQNKQLQHLNFKFVINCIEDARHYLNLFIDQLNQRFLQEIIFLLGRLLDKICKLQSYFSQYGDSSKKQLVYMILKTVNNFLTIDSFQNSLRVHNSRYSRVLLQNLLQQSYLDLLKTEETTIVSSLINISYELSVKYVIQPNYHLIKYILINIITKQSLFHAQTINHISVQMSHKIETLLLKFLMAVKLQQNSNNKTKNVHHLQIVFQYYNFIQFNLANAYQFAKNQDHPFDYEHINNNISFSLNLFSHIIKKFKSRMLSQRQNLQSLLLLIRPKIIDLLVDLMIAHQGNQYERDQFIIIMEQTTSVVLAYLKQIKNKYSTQYTIKLLNSEESTRKPHHYFLTDMLFLIKVIIGELQQLID